ncbi:DEAD/DEAH box helicase [Fictibacillus sp. FJAT-27399]|uniref:DEAD/DEAH box helicase n=1 Tax=Fictibacillus sp. FJAT-27399 TaxID=1729689 RepID=UPI0007816D90|nr:DEAD/DEAH box helicase [Fictibacillus sp. FJAT-27399]
MRFVSFFVDGKSVAVPEVLKPPDVSTVPVSFHKLQVLDTPDFSEVYPFSAELQASLSGKLLLFEELPYSIDVIHEHYLNGCLAYEKGIEEAGGSFVCKRCGNDKPRLFSSFSCFRCKERECVYCRKCLVMGRVSQCTPLVRWCGPEVEWKVNEVRLEWEGKLSAAQRKASDELVSRVGGKGELLIWAVCGAGKTEVLFYGLERALKAGLRVCLATPRTDVVLELLPRLRKVFPGVTLAGLYGGSEEKLEGAQLVVSTIHQLYRYRDAFDLVVVDEVDAFPYSYDSSLEYAVLQAKKEDALLVYLSATPGRKMKKRAVAGGLPHVKIPLRFHGYPLPVPQFVWCGNWKKRLKKGRLPKNVMNWVEHQLEVKRQGFLFVPSVVALHQVAALLQAVFPGIEGVHAEDPDRKEKVMKFRNGEISILVTTTILERGVTVPYTDVAVLGAEEDIFTESALVQISGRAGRSKDDPAGEVVFFHYGKTNAMVDARRHIEGMNQEAGL